MPVLVTGGAGFVGSHLTDRLLAHGKHVIVCDDLSGGRLANLNAGLASGALTFVYLDLAASLDVIRESLWAATHERFSEVFHLAAGRTGAPELPWEPLMEFAREENARILFVSAGDAHISAAIRTRGIDGAVVRMFGGYGPRMDFSAGTPVPAFVCAAREKRPFPLDGDVAFTQPLTYVDDLVDGLMLVAASGDRSGRPVDLVHSEQTRTIDVARLVAEIAGIPFAMQSQVATEKASRGLEPAGTPARALGWRPRTSLYEGLRRTYAWALHEALAYA